ncbi:uncharacterized protein LOC128202708 [Mya arenaria]|uniref:uncharacterized protein LOC128202708 n=1 Tax=Mya arenaria TaxID=6604 RepID=UPI0022E14419|nr:uncharacterized protein LOC128202708 [Mya arenaria]XP_052759736.1 uncharacterized protein LOC128202708 [Mya arenaria]XP_052759737.1 uncharacterized protein LOC128202708 [Mya arenaria]XP_052759738.1 uncharacterized protein LOC128202708 [Mya arenaria]XP_052759739.1 uncharacterized protein LOC128202708 [Mya arenaria]XP_052759740.1 uncharacterized protein LOC128202708 [Mya arenaria]
MAMKANIFYARPVVLGNSSGTSNFRTNKPEGQRIPVKKQTRFADLENTEPPPRPPPPRPSRPPKQGEVTRIAHTEREVKRRLPTAPTNSVSYAPTYATPEPKPLTRLNVTSHERLWMKDAEEEENGPTNILSPPMKYITPESTEEMVRNFDPLDIDNLSDHSDSSADTMIMMTTEEERKNQEKINHSLKQYTSNAKSKQERTETNRSKASIQSKKNLHIHFADMNGVDTAWRPTQNGHMDSEKVSPLHIKTDPLHAGSSPESATNKSNSNHTSPNDSPDDGYGTNSSTGTVSSPFSSSFGSSDFDHANSGGAKRVILPNGAIKPNSVRESWAVKRKQRMIEAQDNSVQEQLRELTIIEEEGGGSSGGNRGMRNENVNINRFGLGKIKNSEKSVLKNGLQNSALEQNQNGESPFVNVSQSDLHRINRQLYVLANERDAILGNDRAKPVLQNGPSESDSGPLRRAPPPPSNSNSDNVTYSVPQRRSQTLEAPRNSQQTVESGQTQRTRSTELNGNEGLRNSRGTVNGDIARGLRTNDEVFYSQPIARAQRTGPDHVQATSNQWEDESDTSALDSVSSGPFLLRGGEQKYRTPSGSGKIYVSPNGDEGFYSLNRSSRSTSVSSFQPINEIPEPIPMATGNANESEAPKSPLEKLSGELLEKWSDMDRNYRNYYGFDENEKKYSRTDSKVNYFQEKKINNMYGHDNYYRPQYGSEAALNQGQGQRSMSMRQPPTNQGILRDSKEKTSASKSSSSKRTEKPEKSGKEKESKGNKLFQILPNMFKPSSKKGNSESKDSKGHKPKRLLPVPVVVTETKPEVKHDNTEEYEQAEYLNIGDLPQYCLASVEQEEKLKKGQYVSLESLHKRPVFASSRDIKKLFSNHDQSFDSINSPGAQRHSFHAMPLSYRHRSGMMPGGDGDNDMRPRASSASASMRTQQMQNSVESRMALIARKNVQVMNQAHQARMEDNSSVGNTSFQSNSSNQRPSGSRTRLDSGSSGGDSKLSTLV